MFPRLVFSSAETSLWSSVPLPPFPPSVWAAGEDLIRDDGHQPRLANSAFEVALLTPSALLENVYVVTLCLSLVLLFS